MNKEKAERMFPEAKETFFRAMERGYASDTPMVRPIGLPGHKLYEYAEGRYIVTDCYWKTPHSAYSGGTTLIYVDGSPIWSMRYFGRYDKAAIPFLKSVLAEEYRMRRFFGGRGPQKVHDFVGESAATYHNTCLRPEFDQFNGRESIYEIETRYEFGYHSYEGGWLVE